MCKLSNILKWVHHINFKMVRYTVSPPVGVRIKVRDPQKFRGQWPPYQSAEMKPADCVSVLHL